MKTFKAKIIDDAGAHTLLLAAESESAALEAAERLGKVIYCKSYFDINSLRKLKSEEREQFLTQLSFLSGSGVGTGEALRILQATHDGRLESLSGEILSQIEAGESLSDALATAGSRDFSPVLLALVASGYRSGYGAESLRTAANFEADMRDLSHNSGSDLFAAFSGFVTSVVCTLFSVYYMGPKVMSSDIAKVAGDGIDVAWAVTAGSILGFFLLLITFMLLALYFNHTIFRRILPEFSDKISQRIPLWCDLALSKERFLAFFSLKALSDPGLSLEQAFTITANGIPPGVFRKELVAASQAIKTGTNWVDALKSLTPIDKAALKVAGDRKHLADIFGKLSEQYRARYANSRKSTAVLLKLTAAFCLTLAGGLLFAVSILPMLQATQAILQ